MRNDLTTQLTDHLPHDPHDLAAALYGPSWRTSLLAGDGDVSFWRTRRLPPPLQVAPLLVPVLEGLAGHDGRSTRDGRGTGWWLRDDLGSWRESDSDGLGLEILPGLQALTVTAREHVEEASRALRALNRETVSPARFDEARSRVSDARLRATLLEALSALVASGSSGRWGAVVAALRSPLRLPSDALAGIVLEALRDVADVEDWNEGDRLSPASIWEAVEESGGGGLLPRRTFLRVLPALLGDLRMIGGHRFYVLPDLDEVEVP